MDHAINLGIDGDDLAIDRRMRLGEIGAVLQAFGRGRTFVHAQLAHDALLDELFPRHARRARQHFAGGKAPAKPEQQHPDDPGALMAALIGAGRSTDQIIDGMKQLGFKEVKPETLFPAELLALPHPQPVVTPAAQPTKAATAAKKKGRK